MSTTDMRLYTATDIYEDAALTSEWMNRVHADDKITSGMEVIAGKVVKFMLTEKGSDAFNPEYGGTSMHYLQISSDYLPRYQMEVMQDLENCLKFISESEIAASVTEDRIASIKLLDVSYDQYNTPTRVDVYIEIITMQGKRAVVAITPRTGS